MLKCPPVQMLFYFFVAVGCAKGAPPSHSHDNTDMPKHGTLLTYEIHADPEPAKYKITFQLNALNEGSYDLYRVTKIDDMKTFKLMSHLHGPKTETTMDVVATGETLDLELFESQPDAGVPTQTLKITLPRDLVISGRVKANEVDFSNVTRLYLLASTVITTNGEDLKIQTGQLFSEKGALIETFQAGSLASDNQAGRAGGNIEVLSDRATGELSVNLRGQNAGKWTKEPPSLENDEGSRGPKGQPGSPSKMTCVSTPNPTCTCVTNSGAGGPGGDGKPGLAGFPGLSGGDSGDLNLNISDGSRFLVTYHREFGQGGAGSAGGLGGPPGLGGYPGAGSPSPFRVCVEAASGPPGKPGPRGPVGVAGKVGKAGKVCLKLTESAETKCM